MKNYRLKPEAVPFFKEKHATSVYDYATWESLGIDEVALEEVEKSFLTYGHKDKTTYGSTTSLNGWSPENGSNFHFTIHFPSTKYMEHDKFSNGKVVRELMNRIEKEVEFFFLKYVNKEED